MTSKSLKIKRVETNRDLHEFVILPWKIYHNARNWVPPLIADVKETVDKRRNPFFCHADCELYIAQANNETLGRIAVIIDYNYCKYHKKNVGFFGFFETVNDYSVAEVLFNQAIKYHKDKMMTEIYGPANPSLNDEVGFLIQGFDLPPMIKMPYNPSYYIDFVERFGFRKIKDLYGYLIDVDKSPPEKLVRVVESIKNRKDIKVRTVNLKNLKQDLLKIKEIYNNAWSNNWDFAPMTEQEIDYLAKKLKSIAVPEIIPIVEIAGEPAGISIGLPDYNQVLKRLNGRLFPFGVFKFLKYRNKITAARLWALGVKDKFRNIGIDALLYYETFLGARKKGYKWGEVSWVLEDNLNIIRPILLWDAKLYKTYRVYQLTI